MSDSFFSDLKGFSRFAELTDLSHYRPAPPGWYVICTDIVGSTQAIAAGKYKEVNLIGAAAIMAILNIAKGYSLPYAFGGDGATMLIPPGLLQKSHDTLGAAQVKVRQMFGLELRAGLIPLARLYAEDTQLLVGRFELSKHVSQAVFQGTALSLAESWLKRGGGVVLRCKEQERDDLDLQGLECRWQPIANRNGEILSLLVKVTDSYHHRAVNIYADILQEIERIYPGTQSNPVTAQGMHLSFSPASMQGEARLRARTALGRFAYLLRMVALNLLGQFSFRTGKPVGSFDGTRYLSELEANSDSRKFDEMLRMVLDSTKEQAAALEACLERHRSEGRIVYGIHHSSHALMTCLVFNLSGNHVHFVDGSDGGYALAAKQMKQQMVG